MWERPKRQCEIMLCMCGLNKKTYKFCLVQWERQLKRGCGRGANENGRGVCLLHSHHCKEQSANCSHNRYPDVLYRFTHFLVWGIQAQQANLLRVSLLRNYRLKDLFRNLQPFCVPFFHWVNQWVWKEQNGLKWQRAISKQGDSIILWSQKLISS